jgi:hypothetical protein
MKKSMDSENGVGIYPEHFLNISLFTDIKNCFYRLELTIYNISNFKHINNLKIFDKQSEILKVSKNLSAELYLHAGPIKGHL